MKSQSIAVFTADISAAGAAMANHTAALLQGLHECGIPDLSVVYLQDQPGAQASIPAAVKRVPLGVSRSRQAILPLRNYLKAHSPDLLITLAAFINLPAILAWRLAGVKTQLMVSQHSTMSYKAYVECKDNFWMRNYPRMAKRLYPWANAVHANSPEVMNDLIQVIRLPMSSDRIFWTPNPVNAAYILDQSQQAPDHPWLRQKDKPVILSVGRLAHQKNFPLLLRAFARVRRSLDARLIILGEDGPARSQLETLIQEQQLEADVSLAGFSANPWSYMAAADVFVLPSQEEPFGLVLVEAMACGLPVIATNAIGGGPRLILEDSQYGLLLPPDDVDAMAAAILKVLSAPEVHQHLSTVGRHRAQDYNPKAIAQQWLSYIHQMP